MSKFSKRDPNEEKIQSVDFFQIFTMPAAPGENDGLLATVVYKYDKNFFILSRIEILHLAKKPRDT